MKTVTKVMSDGTKIVYDEYGNDQLKTVLKTNLLSFFDEIGHNFP